MILPRVATSIRRRAGRRAGGALGVAIGLCVALALPRPAAAESPFLRRTAAVRAVEKAGPAVVNITTETEVKGRPFRPFGGDPVFNRFFRDFFEPTGPRTTRSLGSGVVIDAEGHVLTNEHVVGQADVISVSLADGREFGATLVGADPNNDLAVLHLKGAHHVPWIAPGTSSDLMVGEPVIAIGNPFGLSNSVTTGVVSALHRSLRTNDRVFHGFLQTDASINPGNSGGPLLNAAGQLIGINSAIYQDAQGIGFAIPIDVAKRVVHELLTRGEMVPVWLGVDLQDLDQDLVDALGLPRRVGGALVSRVRKGSAGEAAGLRPRDVVMEMDGTPVVAARDFYDVLRRSTPGQDLAIHVWRDGKKLTLDAKPTELPASTVATLCQELLGVRLELVKKQGYRVTSVRQGGGAARIGMQPGDWLLGVNGQALDGPEALRRAVLDLRGRPSALVVVARGAGRYHVTIPIS